MKPKHLPASEISVEHFSHIVFLPFRIRRENDEDGTVDFGEIANFLSEDNWYNGSASVSALMLEADSKRSTSHWQKMHHAQSHAYFHPFAREVLFDKVAENNPFRRTFHRTDIYGIETTLATRVWGEPPENQHTLYFDVVRCELEVFQLGIAILVLEIRHKPRPEVLLNLALVEQVQDELRRLYASYFDDYIENDQKNINSALGKHVLRQVKFVQRASEKTIPIALAESLEKALANHKKHFDDRFSEEPSPSNFGFKYHDHGNLPLFQHWSDLLAPFTPHGSTFTYSLLGDDRLPTMSYVACKEPSQVSEGDWVRMAFADATGTDTLPYAKQFLNDFERHYCYDRFWYRSGESTDSASRITNVGYHFAWVGYSSDGTFFTNGTNGAFATWRTIYSRMALFAHMQKAALLTVSNRIAALSRDGNANYDSQQVRALYQEFISFTHAYWFDEISPQLQGIELFAMWQKHLRTKELHAEVRQELTDLVSNISLEAQEAQAKSSIKLTRIATGFAAASLVVGFFGMNFFSDKGVVPIDQFFTLIKPEGDFPASWADIGYLRYGLLPAVALVFALAFGVFKLGNWWVSREKRYSKTKPS